MIVGHFGFAAIVKARRTSIPLWILMFASVWLDIVFVPLFLMGMETMEPLNGKPGYGREIIHAEYTHSLIGMLVLSGILALVCCPRWGLRSAYVIGFTASSHWLLNLTVHRSDIPILPGSVWNLPLLGFGLWRMPVLSAGLEMALILGGAWTYWRAARPLSSMSRRSSLFGAAAAIMIAISGLLVLVLDLTS